MYEESEIQLGKVADEGHLVYNIALGKTFCHINNKQLKAS